MAERKKAAPTKVAANIVSPCCKKLEKIQSLLTNVPTYLPPDKLREVRKVLEAPMSDYE